MKKNERGKERVKRKKLTFQTILDFDEKSKKYITKKHFLQLWEREFKINKDLSTFSLIKNEFLSHLFSIKKQLLALNANDIPDFYKVIVMHTRGFNKWMIEAIDILVKNVDNLFDFFLGDLIKESDKLGKRLNELLFDDYYYFTVLHPEDLDKYCYTKYGFITNREYLQREGKMDENGNWIRR